MHLLGFHFAPRIRDLKDAKLSVPKSRQNYAALLSMIGGNLNVKSINAHWDEILLIYCCTILVGKLSGTLMVIFMVF